MTTRPAMFSIDELPIGCTVYVDREGYGVIVDVDAAAERVSVDFKDGYEVAADLWQITSKLLTEMELPNYEMEVA